MTNKPESRTCFVIMPIGDEGSEIRRRADQGLEHIIAPAATECGYETVRADRISAPGIITSQVIQRLLDDDLVVADLSGRNPNVYYELAVRHMVKKPVVQIIEKGEAIPFDLETTRTIPVDHHDLDSADECRKELVRQIKVVEKDPILADNPITMAVDLQALRQSGNLIEKSMADIISMLTEIRSSVSAPAGPVLTPEHMRSWYALINRIIEVIKSPSDDPERQTRMKEAEGLLYQLMLLINMARFQHY